MPYRPYQVRQQHIFACLTGDAADSSIHHDPDGLSIEGISASDDIDMTGDEVHRCMCNTTHVKHTLQVMDISFINSISPTLNARSPEAQVTYMHDIVQTVLTIPALGYSGRPSSHKPLLCATSIQCGTGFRNYCSILWRHLLQDSCVFAFKLSSSHTTSVPSHPIKNMLAHACMVMVLHSLYAHSTSFTVCCYRMSGIRLHQSRFSCTLSLHPHSAGVAPCRPARSTTRPTHCPTWYPSRDWDVVKCAGGDWDIVECAGMHILVP